MMSLLGDGIVLGPAFPVLPEMAWELELGAGFPPLASWPTHHHRGGHGNPVFNPFILL